MSDTAVLDAGMEVQKPQGFLQKLRRGIRKKGAILSFDSTNYLLVLIIFVGLGLVGLGALEGYKVVSCKLELNDIATAADTYEGLRIDGNRITNLGDLVKDESIGQTESVDGVAHGRFLKATERWKEGGLTNPWGLPYNISGDQITTTSKIGLTFSAPLSKASHN